MSSVPSGRILALESVRGIASAAVVVSHLVMAFADPYPSGRPANIESLPVYQQIVIDSVYRPIRDGQFAVMVFFVLSGVVLSQGYLHRGRFSDLLEAIVRRYPRLAIPAVASACLACFLWQAGLIHNKAAAQRLEESGTPAEWLKHFDQPAPTYFAAIRQSAFDVFFGKDLPEPPGMYNPVLWTMRSEFYGSLLVFGILGLCGRSRRITAISITIAVLFIMLGQMRMALFPAGIALAAIKRDRPTAVLPPVMVILLLATAYGLCGAYHLGDFTPLALWNGGIRYVVVEQVCGFAAILTVAVVLFTPRLAGVLEGKRLVWLGKISFGLYLIHVPVVLSIGSGTFLREFPDISQAGSMFLAGLIVFAVCLPGAWLMFQLFDQPAVWISKQLSRRLVRPSSS